jgi:hypothetical protein
MSVEDNEGDLATQYVLARRQRPDLDVDELVKYIIARLSKDELLSYAEETPPWAPHVADRRELAVSYVRNFVLAMEADPNAPG